MALLYAGTDAGLCTFRVDEDEVSHVGTSLEDEAVRDVEPVQGADGDVYVACGEPGWGVSRVDERGRSVTRLGLDDRWGWGVTVAPDGTLIAGTEPPGVYRSPDEGETWEAASDVEALAADSDWFFWSEPFEAGHVHGFGVHQNRPERILAGVEIGGALRSDDGGRTWTTIDDLDGYDLHSLEPDPADPDRWYAASGDGLYRSDDGGDSWGSVDPLADQYVADLSFDAAGRPCVSAAPDSKADEGTFWRLDGDEWKALHTSPANSLSGIVATHPGDADVLYHTQSTPEECRLLVSRDGGAHWEVEGPAVPRIRTMALA